MFQKYIDYILHDTSVNDITVEEYGLALLFRNGAYVLDEAGNEPYLSKPCKMNIFIEDFDKNRLFEHCTFFKSHRKHVTEVDLSEVKKLLLKNNFKIYLDFYSPFANAISIRGNIGKHAVELIVTEIQSIKFETI